MKRPTDLLVMCRARLGIKPRAWASEGSGFLKLKPDPELRGLGPRLVGLEEFCHMCDRSSVGHTRYAPIWFLLEIFNIESGARLDK